MALAIVQEVKYNKQFFGLLVLFLSAGIMLELVVGSTDFSLWMNAQHTAFGDVFFRFATYLGDGVLVGIIILLLLFVRCRYAFLMLVAMVLNTAVIQWLKHFYNHPRPSLVFQDLSLQYVEGVKLYQHFGFPSGHTAAAFGVYTLLALFSGNKISGLMYGATALLVGLSRIYLMQHFLEDVLLGATIGSGISFLIYLGFRNNKTLQQGWWNRPVTAAFRKK